MKNLKIISYQRNGVGGNGFFVATCNEFGKDFVVTFETDGQDSIDAGTCRAICLDDLAEKWRGDDFAFEMQIIINKRLKPRGAVYDLIEAPKHTHNATTRQQEAI